MHDDGDDAARRDERVRALESELASALAERNEHWADAQRARALEQELVHARGIIADMQASASWRVTTLLRSSKRRAGTTKRLTRRVREGLRGG